MDLIKQREKRTIRRKIAKHKFDNMITLSADVDDGIRLLDEGAVMAGDDSVWFWVEKGSLERYLNALDDDFVGYIKLSHNDFSNFPILLGSYAKSDLYLRDMENGRKSLYVKPTFFDTYLLKDIQKMPFSVGVSVEMNCFLDEEATEEMGFPVYRDLFISGFAIVGEGGNVNSNGIRLSGGEKVAYDLKAINEALENQSAIDLSALSDVLKKFEDKEEVELNADVEEEVQEETEEEVQEEATEEVEASVEEETSMDEILAKVTALSAKVDELTEENKKLSDQIESLETDKTSLSEKLSAKEAEEKKFINLFNNLTCHVSDEKPEVKPEKVASVDAMDRIGEL